MANFLRQFRRYGAQVLRKREGWIVVEGVKAKCLDQIEFGNVVNERY